MIFKRHHNKVDNDRIEHHKILNNQTNQLTQKSTCKALKKLVCKITFSFSVSSVIHE